MKREKKNLANKFSAPPARRPPFLAAPTGKRAVRAAAVVAAEEMQTSQNRRQQAKIEMAEWPKRRTSARTRVHRTDRRQLSSSITLGRVHVAVEDALAAAR